MFFTPALCSPFGWACFLLGLDFGSWEIGIVCRSDGTQACGKPDLFSPGLASLTLHAHDRIEPALLDLMPPNSHLPSPSLAQILLLAQLLCCSQYSSGNKVLLSFGEVALMVRAETSQDDDSVVPPTMWFFAVPSTMLLQKWKTFPYSAEIMRCVSQGLILEVLLESRGPARYFLHVCASLKLLARTKIFDCGS